MKSYFFWIVFGILWLKLSTTPTILILWITKIMVHSIILLFMFQKELAKLMNKNSISTEPSCIKVIFTSSLKFHWKITKQNTIAWNWRTILLTLARVPQKIWGSELYISLIYRLIILSCSRFKPQLVLVVNGISARLCCKFQILDKI